MDLNDERSFCLSSPKKPQNDRKTAKNKTQINCFVDIGGPRCRRWFRKRVA